VGNPIWGWFYRLYYYGYIHIQSQFDTSCIEFYLLPAAVISDVEVSGFRLSLSEKPVKQTTFETRFKNP